jgi:alpha-mannosidase
LLKDHPNYRFTLDQAAYFRPFLERYPEEAQTFRKFVAAGRLELVGGMDVMPDDNLPGGETFVRQVLYAKGYCREQLGVEVKVGWLLDTFGHHSQMPQVLKLAGFNSFWFSRGVADRNIPSEFLWEGIDGTQIPAFWLPFSYGHAFGSPKEPAAFNQFIRQRFVALSPYSRGADRVALCGVDVSEPELSLPALVERFNEQPDAPFELRLGVPTDFEAAVARRSDRPVLKADRNPLFQGVYSSRIELKQWMRTMEQLLTAAEKFGALANWLGVPTDDAMAWRAWEPVLFNLTHDLASGVMTDKVYEDTVRSYEFSKRLANELIESRLSGILSKIDTRGEGIAAVVFNTLGWPRTDVAEVDAGFAEGGINGFSVTDPDGLVIPAQLLAAERYQDGGLKRVKFAFVAREIPPLGYALYRVLPQGSTAAATSLAHEVKDGNSIENEFYRASFDPATGALTNLLVKAGDWQAVIGPANLVAREEDNGDFWELYKNLDGGQHLLMTRPMGAPQRGKAAFSDEDSSGIGVVHQGAVFSEFAVKHAFGKGTFATSVRIYAGIPRLDFRTDLLNNDKFVRYRLLFPTAIRDGRNVQEIPFGAIERPAAQEFPAQNWMDYGDGRRGVALLNRGLPGNNVAEGTLMLSLMRSTRIQAYGEGGGYERGMSSDSGLELGKELAFHYALVPHAGDWRAARTYRAGLEFNHPLMTRKAASHAGRLPKRWSFLGVSASNVVVSALKPGRDGTTILRVYEAEGKSARGVQINIGAKIVSAFEANLMEDSVRELKTERGALQFDLHPFEIKTFKLRLRAMN